MDLVNDFTLIQFFWHIFEESKVLLTLFLAYVNSDLPLLQLLIGMMRQQQYQQQQLQLQQDQQRQDMAASKKRKIRD